MTTDTTFNQDVSNDALTPTDGEKFTLNLKVDGEEVTKEFTQEELKAYVQKGMSADEKFRTAAELKKSVEEERNEIDNIIKSAFEFDDDDETPSTENNSVPEEKSQDDIVIKQLQAELREVKNKQYYADAKNEIEAIQQSRGLDDKQVIELITYIQDQKTKNNKILSLDDAYKIVYFEDRERPNKLTPESGASKKKTNEINAWKNRILNAT